MVGDGVFFFFVWVSILRTFIGREHTPFGSAADGSDLSDSWTGALPEEGGLSIQSV